MSELKPCPFCGTSEFLRLIDSSEMGDDAEGITVCCDVLFNLESNLPTGCGAACGYQKTEEAATEAWNIRHGWSCRG